MSRPSRLRVWLGLDRDDFTRQKTVRFGDPTAVGSGRLWSIVVVVRRCSRSGRCPRRSAGSTRSSGRRSAAPGIGWSSSRPQGFRNVPLWEHVGISVYRVLSGVFYGALVGIPLGFAMGLSSVARGLFDPIVEFMRPVPPLALIPLAILWFGIDETAKIVLLFLAALFIMTIAARSGAASVNIAKVHAAYSLGASRFQVLRHVILPNALPEIFTGLRTAMGVCWGTVVAAELVAADRGLGSMIMIAKNFLQTDTVVIGIVIIGLIGYAIELADALAGAAADPVAGQGITPRRQARHRPSGPEEVGMLAFEGDETVGDDGNVAAHGAIRLARLVGRYRGLDGAVLGERGGHAARLGQEQAAYAVEVHAQGVQRLGDAAEAQAVGQQAVEGDVELEEAVEVRSRDRRVLVAEVARQCLARLGGKAARRLGGHLRLDRPARHHPLPHVIEADARNVRPPLGLDPQQPLVGEPVDRGVHRQTRDAEA